MEPQGQASSPSQHMVLDTFKKGNIQYIQLFGNLEIISPILIFLELCLFNLFLSLPSLWRNSSCNMFQYVHPLVTFALKMRKVMF